MSQDLLIALIGLVGTIGGGVILLYRELNKVHKIINSRMDELLELTRKTAHAAGVIEGEEKEARRESPDA